MPLNYVTLILDLADGTGFPHVGGIAVLAPSVQLADTADNLLFTVAPVQVPFPGGGFPQVKLLATDNGAPAPSGWAWQISFRGAAGMPAGFSFFLPYGNGATQYLSSLAPVAGELPVTITSLDGGSAATGVFPVGAFDGGDA